MWWRKHRPRPQEEPGDGDAAKRAEQEALLRRAERMTPAIEKYADTFAKLPPDEFAARIQAAMTLVPRRG